MTWEEKSGREEGDGSAGKGPCHQVWGPIWSLGSKWWKKKNDLDLHKYTAAHMRPQIK